MTLRSLFALLAGVLVLLACGERAETESYSVRGQVVRVADGGRSLVVEHEAIPGLMDAMRMTFPVQDAAASKGIAAGDRIRFDLFVSDGDYVIGAIEKLPADTELDLSGSLH